MKKIIYEKTRNFRITTALDEAIANLSVKAHRQESDLIREAIWQFVQTYQDHPHEIRKVA